MAPLPDTAAQPVEGRDVLAIDDDRRRVHPLLGTTALALTAFALSRVGALAFFAAVSLITGRGVTALLASWDGAWYLEIAINGYPSELPGPEHDGAQTSAGFFPAYPFILRWVAALTGLSPAVSAIWVSMIFGAMATVLVAVFARSVVGRSAARRTAVLFAVFPGSYVLSMAYSESLLVTAAAVCLIALRDQRWFLAGLAAAMGTAARPNGIALVAACAVAALPVVWRQRTPKPLIAPLLAPAGLVAFMAFLTARLGDPFAYVKSQSRGWDQGFDFGWSTAGRVVDVLASPLGDLNQLVAALSLAFVVVAAVLLVRLRPPLEVLAYVAVIIALAFGSTVLVSSPRFVLTAFPLLLGPAASLRGPAFAAVTGVSGVLLATLVLLSGATIAVTP